MDIRVNAVSPPSIREWSRKSIEAVDSCRLCKNIKCDLLHESLCGQVLFRASSTRILRCCTTCSFGYLDPRPRLETVGLVLSRHIPHLSTNSASTESLTVLRRLQRTLANRHHDSYFDTHHQPNQPCGFRSIRALPTQTATVDTEIRNLLQPQPE